MVMDNVYDRALLLTPDGKVQPIVDEDVSHAHWLLKNVPSINIAYPYVDDPNDEDGTYMDAILGDASDLGYLRSRYWGQPEAMFGIDGERAFSPEELAEVYKYYELPLTVPFDNWDRSNQKDWVGNYADYLERWHKRKRQSELAKLIAELR